MLFSDFAHPSDMDDFIRLEVDLDGKLTKTEFLKMATDRGAGRCGGSADHASDQFTMADADGDDRSSSSEFPALRGKRYSPARP